MKLRYSLCAIFIFLIGLFLSLQAFLFYRQQALHPIPYQNPWNFWEVLILGTLGSGVVASYFLVFLNRHLLTEQRVKERTNALAAINQALKENEAQLKQAIHEAEAANRARNTFLATISHELKTPLNAIIGFDQCLLMGMDGPVTKQQRDSLKKIETSSLHLLSLINNILDFTKIEAKGMVLELKSYNLIDLIHACVEDIRPLAFKKNLAIQVSIPLSFLPLLIDKGSMRQVLLNLLGNAVKFTETGSIKVLLAEEKEAIEIHIIDTGIGLSPEDLKNIFLPFSQADSSITRKYGGTGLGLAISKKIIELHGGTIRVISEKGKGSTFIIRLLRRQNRESQFS